MYGKILIPVDMSHTEKAADMIAAGRKIGNADAEFLLVNIVHSVPAMAELSVPVEFFDRAREEATKALEDVAAEAGIKATVVVQIGQPASDILSIAEDMNADLVIIGSHRPGLQDYFLGSTASRVVRHAQCPVLVMR